MECKIKLSTRPEAENKSDMDSLAGHDSNGCNSNGSDLAKEIADQVAAADDKSDKDSSVGHDPHACDDAGLHDANEITDEVVATENKCDMNSSADPDGYGDAGLQGGDELMNEVADADNKSDMDSSAGHDPQGCDNAGLHDANDSVDNKSRMDSASGHDSQGGDDAGLPSAKETADDFETADSSSLDALKLKIPALTEQTVCSDSLSGDKLAESVSKKPDPPPRVSCAAIGMGNKPLLDFSVKDNMQSSVQCPLVPLNDTLVMSSSLDASDEVKIPVSVEGTACSDSLAEDKLAQFASGRKCMSSSDISHDALELENKPAMDFPVEDHAQSLEVSDMDGVHEINDIDCLEPVPSSGEIFAENTKEINEKQDVSDFTQNGSGECSLQFKYDSNIQIVCETEGTSHASDSDDKSETAARERKIESSSV